MDENESRSDRFVRTVEWIADAITGVVKLIAFTLVLIFYTLIGGLIYVAFLAQGILLFSVKLIFKLMAQKTVRPDIREFEAIIRSWPIGFRTLSISFWKLPPEPEEKELIEPAPATHPIRLPWFFGALQVTYTAVFCLFIYGIWMGQNPFGRFLSWDNLIPTLFGLVVILGGLAMVENVLRIRWSTPEHHADRKLADSN